MYDSRVFLNALFGKLHVYDKNVREHIFDLYHPMVEVILTTASDEERISIFKDLLPLFQHTADYFNRIYSQNQCIDKYSIKLMKNIILHYTNLLEKYYASSRNSEIFNKIMKQVNIDEMACDIGVYISTYKSSKGFRQKSNIIKQLKVLLIDYNSITHSFLTLRDILTKNNMNVTEL